MKIDVAEVVVADLSHKTANLITETLVSQGSKCSRLNKSGGHAYVLSVEMSA